MQAASGTPNAAAAIASDTIPPDVLKDAANEANALAGTSVEIKTEPGGDFTKVLVTTNGDTGGLLAGTAVDDNDTPDPADDEASSIVINIEKLKKLFPGIMDDPELLKRILKHILAHEFDHVPGGSSGGSSGGGGGGQGGNGHSGGLSCVHLADFVSDCSAIQADIDAVKADQSLDAAEKCKIVAALCKLFKHIQGHANSPESVAAAANCPNVTVSNGALVANSPDCPDVECPVHGHNYGSV